MQKKKSIGSVMSQYFIIIIFIAVVVMFAVLNANFLSAQNIIVILKQTSIIGIASFGMMFVIISGGFDMSVGSTMAFAGIIAALLGNGDYPIFVPLIAALAGGTIVGLINGIGVAKGHVPAFIMTLGTMQAARVAGINTVKNKIAVFTIMGLLAGFCGFLMTSRTTVGQPTAADGYEMDAIAACVIGGVSMSGSIGKPWGVIVGAFLITVITNGLDSIGVNSSWQKVVKGIIIIIAVLIDMKGKVRKK